MHQAMQKPMPSVPQNDSSMAPLGWQQAPQPGTVPPAPGPHQGGGGQQQLSVVTTVWGVTTSTQSGPLAHGSFGGTNTTMAQTPYSTGQQTYPSGPGTLPPKSYPSIMNSRQNGPGYNGYGSNPSSLTPGMAGSMLSSGHGAAGDFPSQHSALSAAAAVVAATATATATASVVALQERQQNSNVNNQYGQVSPMQGSLYQSSYGPPPGSLRMPSSQTMSNGMSAPMGNSMVSPMNSMTGHIAGNMNNMNSPMMNMPSSVSPMTMNGAMGMNSSNMSKTMNSSVQPPHPAMYGNSSPGVVPQTRARGSPYPSPQQHMAQKRPAQYNPVVQQYPPGMQHYGPNTQHNYSPAQYPGGQPNQFTKQQPYNPSIQQQTITNPNYLTQQQMRPTIRPQAPPYVNQSGQYYPQGQMNGTPQQNSTYEPQYGPQYSQQTIQRNLNYQPSPIPGNPTPPLTPASGIPPYLSPNPDLKPTFPEMKPSLPAQKDDELRLTFPVRDGVILAPFRLEHNLAVSNHVFHLKPSVHQTLMWRTDLELQLKCFHHEDRQMNTNWPASVQASVNATPLCIDRGENKTSHKPLYLKEVCQPGRNTIQITVTACCCSHLFLLQLVHRPTVRSVLQGLLRKRLLPAEHCIAKIKRNFTNVAASATSAMNGEDGVEQTAIKVSLKCPITFKRITLPARGQECKHIQGFDLESYLQLNSERGAWRCPVCNKPALLEGLEVDQYIWGILTNLSNSDVEEVTIDATASWKPVPIKTIKEEHDHEGDMCSAQKRFKAMSPNSMTMPTTSSWEMGQGLSPYSALPTPDMQSISNGPIANGPMMTNGVNYGNPSSGFDFHSQASDFSSPLSHLNESVSSLDPLAAMEKSLIHHEQQMGPPVHEQTSNSSLRHPPTPSASAPVPGANAPHQTQPQQQQQQQQPATPSSQSQNIMQHGPQTPHTPHTPHTPGSSGDPSSVPPASQAAGGGSSENSSSGQSNGHTNSSADHSSLSHAPDLSDLNFDPAAVIDGEGQGQEGLNLLPESVDPMELLSYLDTPDLGSSVVCSGSTNATTVSSTLTTATNSITTSSSNSANDDLLALFET